MKSPPMCQNRRDFGALRSGNRRAFWRACLALSLSVSSLTTLPVAPAFAQQKMTVALSEGTVTKAVLQPGTTLTISTSKPFTDLVIGNPDVADVVPLSEQSLYIQGKANGFTNVSIYDDKKMLLGVIDVRVKANFDSVSASIKAAVPSANVKVTNVNDKIRLTGTVRDAVDLARVLEVAQQYQTEPVINALAVGDAQQVNLEVRVIEASRVAGRDLGVNLRVKGGTSLIGTGAGIAVNSDDTGTPQTFLTDAPGRAGSVTQESPFGTMVAQVLEGAGVRVDVIIDALEKKGLARRLAQPNLTTLSGEVAKFTVGGEVPIQSSTNNAGVLTTQTDYRQYGVVLEFAPTVLDRGRINLRIKTEVSELDRTVTVNGNPGFISRKADTVMELRDGQSFAMAGLLQTINDRDIKQVPWLGSVPVLGALFRSTSFQKKETDLVIVVTPRLVRPSSPDEVENTPLDTTRPSDDVELFALGIMEVDKDTIRAYREGRGVTGPYGHIIDLPFGDGNAIAKK